MTRVILKSKRKITEKTCNLKNQQANYLSKYRVSNHHLTFVVFKTLTSNSSAIVIAATTMSLTMIIKRAIVYRRIGTLYNSTKKLNKKEKDRGLME